MIKRVSSEPDIIQSLNIQNMIYTIRGVQVMVDSDLATVYEVETRVLNQAVKRNVERFPEEFRFQLTLEEYDELVAMYGTFNVRFRKDSNGQGRSLRSQSVTLKTGRGKHRKYLPYVFTEQGVSMLAAVLRSSTAIKVSIQIINAFVELRRFFYHNANVFARLEAVERRQTAFEAEAESNFEKVFLALESGEPPRQGIFFDGQVYDAYRFVADLIRKAKKSLILIDNYVDDSVLTLLCKRKRRAQVTVYTKTISKQLALDHEKHNQQYPPITLKVLKNTHDRFLIIDENEMYHIGASLKDLGKKWFAFSRIETGIVSILQRLKKIK